MDPVSLSLVCRFWHAVVAACPTLWADIIFDPCKGIKLISENERQRLCRNWSDLERALTRAGTATITLGICLINRLHSHDDKERLLRLFSRCRNLGLGLDTVNQYTLPTSIILPHLESLTLYVNRNAHIEPLLDSIESNSPLLWSLFIHGDFPANLTERESLLRQLVQLHLNSPPEDSVSFFRGLQNLEQLR
jgi:hypothetical protein